MCFLPYSNCSIAMVADTQQQHSLLSDPTQLLSYEDLRHHSEVSSAYQLPTRSVIATSIYSKTSDSGASEIGT